MSASSFMESPYQYLRTNNILSSLGKVFNQSLTIPDKILLSISVHTVFTDGIQSSNSDNILISF